MSTPAEPCGYVVLLADEGFTVVPYDPQALPGTEKMASPYITHCSKCVRRPAYGMSVMTECLPDCVCCAS